MSNWQSTAASSRSGKKMFVKPEEPRTIASLMPRNEEVPKTGVRRVIQEALKKPPQMKQNKEITEFDKNKIKNDKLQSHLDFKFQPKSGVQEFKPQKPLSKINQNIIVHKSEIFDSKIQSEIRTQFQNKYGQLRSPSKTSKKNQSQISLYESVAEKNKSIIKKRDPNVQSVEKEEKLVQKQQFVGKQFAKRNPILDSSPPKIFKPRSASRSILSDGSDDSTTIQRVGNLDGIISFPIPKLMPKNNSFNFLMVSNIKTERVRESFKSTVFKADDVILPVKQQNFNTARSNSNQEFKKQFLDFQIRRHKEKETLQQGSNCILNQMTGDQIQILHNYRTQHRKTNSQHAAQVTQAKWLDVYEHKDKLQSSGGTALSLVENDFKRTQKVREMRKSYHSEVVDQMFEKMQKKQMQKLDKQKNDKEEIMQIEAIKKQREIQGQKMKVQANRELNQQMLNHENKLEQKYSEQWNKREKAKIMNKLSQAYQNNEKIAEKQQIKQKKVVHSNELKQQAKDRKMMQKIINL